jgi:hypothetical protein
VVMARLSPYRGGWSGALMGLMTPVRVLPPATYEQVKASGGLRNSRPHRPITNGMVCPRIVSTDLNDLRLLGAFGECRVMTQTVARRLPAPPLMHRDFRGAYLARTHGHHASATLNHQN